MQLMTDALKVYNDLLSTYQRNVELYSMTLIKVQKFKSQHIRTKINLILLYNYTTQLCLGILSHQNPNVKKKIFRI